MVFGGNFHIQLHTLSIRGSRVCVCVYWPLSPPCCLAQPAALIEFTENKWPLMKLITMYTARAHTSGPVGETPAADSKRKHMVLKNQRELYRDTLLCCLAVKGSNKAINNLDMSNLTETAATIMRDTKKEETNIYIYIFVKHSWSILTVSGLFCFHIMSSFRPVERKIHF